MASKRFNVIKTPKEPEKTTVVRRDSSGKVDSITVPKGQTADFAEVEKKRALDEAVQAGREQVARKKAARSGSSNTSKQIMTPIPANFSTPSGPVVAPPPQASIIRRAKFNPGNQTVAPAPMNNNATVRVERQTVKQRISTFNKAIQPENVLGPDIFNLLATDVPKIGGEPGETEKRLIFIGGGSVVTNVGKSGAKAAAQRVSQSLAARFGKDVAVTTAQTVGITEGAKVVGAKTASADIKAAQGRPGFQEGLQGGFQAESAAARESGLVATILDELTVFGQGKADFQAGAREVFQTQGLAGKELDTAVKAATRQRTASGVGEFAAFLNVGRRSDVFGGKEVGRAFTGAQIVTRKSAGGTIFKVAAPKIALAGATEGFAAEIAQTSARERDLNAKNIALATAFGATSAGIIGGGIAGLAPNRPQASKAINILANVADPFEKPGDLLGEVSEAGFRRFRKVSTPTPAIIPFGKNDVQLATVFGSSSQTPVGGSRARVSNIVQSIPRKGVRTPTSIQAFIREDTPIPPPVTTGVPIPAPIPIQNINFNINTPTSTQVNVPTATSVFVGAPTNIPVNSFLPRIPPPVPLQLPFGFGGKTGKVKRNVFADDLSLFRATLGGSLAPKRKRAKSSKRRKPVRKSKKGRGRR